MYEDFVFRPAVRENIGLFVAFSGPSGSGKTYTAMAVAKGIVKNKPRKRFAVVDTENKRARHYADEFDFDVLDLTAPYNAHRYELAVKKAYEIGYGAIIVDSVSHEHEGDGGYLDQQEAVLKEKVDRYMERYRDAKRWEVEEKLTPSSWVAAKRERKRMILSMLACSVSTPIIFCFRASEKAFTSKDGKLVAHNPRIWEPTTGRDMPYEMTVSLLLDPDKPGRIMKTLKMAGKLAHMFPMDKQLGEQTGEMIAEWAAGAKTKDAAADLPPPQLPFPTQNQLTELRAQIARCGKDADWEAKQLSRIHARAWAEATPAQISSTIAFLKGKNSPPASADHPSPPTEKPTTGAPSRYSHMTDDALKGHLDMLAKRMGARTYDEKIKAIIGEVSDETWKAMSPRDRNEYVAAGLRTPEEEAAK